jgi:hypothetical protein
MTTRLDPRYTPEEHRAARQSRLRRLDALGVLPEHLRAELDEPDPLRDPTSWIEQEEAKVRGAELDELIALQKPLPPEEDPDARLIRESSAWIAEAEKDRRH